MMSPELLSVLELVLWIWLIVGFVSVGVWLFFAIVGGLCDYFW